jgi:hypothetical protein
LVYFSPFWYFGPRKIWQPWWVIRHSLDISFAFVRKNVNSCRRIPRRRRRSTSNVSSL